MLDVIRQRPGNWRTASLDVKEIKSQLTDWIYHEVDGVVQSGPFTGMRILPDTSWKDSYLVPMLLGSYEEELHGEIERQINRLKKLAAPKIVVVGAAEGYYAIGLKCRIPQATVFVVEPDEVALEICGRAATLNGVSVVVAPLNVAMESPDLIVMDCEGNEIHYCDLAQWPQLRGTYLIVEAHNFLPSDTQPEQKTDDILVERFRSTHWITMLVEGPRNPNKHQLLVHMTSDYRWLALSEGRPCLMGWLVMEPKGVYCP
ncbi:MAG: hypothetical protein WAN06_14225 [Candidatus Sulfotelmatobacter sp.]